MRAWLRKLRESRSPRDRALIGVLAALLAFVLYLWLVHSAGRARTQLLASTTVLRAQAGGLEQDATELERIRAAPVPSASTGDLRTLVQARAEAAGLARALVRIDAPDADQVRVVFGAVAFTEWLNWVAGLQAEHIRMASGRIEALATPGMVGVSATFTRAKAQ